MPVTMISLLELFPHPKNPRLTPREDVIEQIAAQLHGQMDEAHALIVRPIDEGYQIISGHHRRLAALRKKLPAVPCWVREMTDEEAYMALVQFNSQGELSALEVGIHAFGFIEKGKHGRSLAAYVGQTGWKEQTLRDRVWGAEVASEIHEHSGISLGDLQDVWLQLAVIHAAPRWLWPVLVQHLMEKSWTVDSTKKAVGALKKIEDPPSWVDLSKITTGLMDGTLKSSDVPKFAGIVAKTTKELTERALDAETYTQHLQDRLAREHPGQLSVVTSICNEILNSQAVKIGAIREAELAKQKAAEASAARVARLRQHVSLKEWEELSSEEQYELLHLEVKTASFNKQKSDAIEWAQWSWNPITGCLHGCSYCYARDITLDQQTKNGFPYGFEPTLKPTTLTAPRSQIPPKEATFDERLKNVFTGSMADIFGRWVPQSWIEAILEQVRAAREWNFLFLTKFPNRMAEFNYPDNAWLGTSVDLQARVENAEKAFAKVNATYKWLSIEPMLEPLKFSRLDLFDWIVIGGASRSTQTPEWHPPFIWIHELMKQAEAAGVPVYAKTNLLGNKSRDGLLNLPGNAPIKPEVTVLPDVFHYLKGA